LVLPPGAPPVEARGFARQQTGGLVSSFEIGSYVTHTKLPELGTGEILASERGAIRIRFASGDRNFLWELVAAHLEITLEPPAMPAKSARRGRKAAAKS
jgi:hypothetical protein